MPKVDSKGRVVLPQDVRERLGISPGTEVTVHEEGGKVVVEPEDDPEQIIERMEQLLDETASKTNRTPRDDVDPLARKHRDAVRRGATQDSDE